MGGDAIGEPGQIGPRLGNPLLTECLPMLVSPSGRIVEYEDGTAGYIQSMSFTQAFRVKIADVTGFSVEKSGKLLTRRFNVLGNGTLLGTAEVNHGTAEVIENWFRSHPLFGTNAGSAPAPGASPSVADEIGCQPPFQRDRKKPPISRFFAVSRLSASRRDRAGGRCPSARRRLPAPR
jgi:hypothetical protein